MSSEETEHRRQSTIRRVYDTVASPPRQRQQQPAISSPVHIRTGLRHLSSPAGKRAAVPERGNLLSPPPKAQPQRAQLNPSSPDVYPRIDDGDELYEIRPPIRGTRETEYRGALPRGTRINDYHEGEQGGRISENLGGNRRRGGSGRGSQPAVTRSGALMRGTWHNDSLRYRTRNTRTTWGTPTTTDDTETTTTDDFGDDDPVYVANRADNHYVEVEIPAERLIDSAHVASRNSPSSRWRPAVSNAQQSAAPALRIVRTRSPVVALPAAAEEQHHLVQARPVYVRRTIPLESPRRAADPLVQEQHYAVVRARDDPAPRDVRNAAAAPHLVAQYSPRHAADYRSPLSTSQGGGGPLRQHMLRVDDDQRGGYVSSSSTASSRLNDAVVVHEGPRNVRYVSPSSRMTQERRQGRPGSCRALEGDRWAEHDWKSDGDDDVNDYGHQRTSSTGVYGQSRLLSPSVRGGLQNAKFAVTPPEEVRHHRHL